MDTTEIANEIFSRYYDTGGAMAHVELHDGTTLIGLFVGFYHDDIDTEDHIPDCWHFVPENEIVQYNNAIMEKHAVGKMIRHKEIRSVGPG